MISLTFAQCEEDLKAKYRDDIETIERSDVNSVMYNLHELEQIQRPKWNAANAALFTALINFRNKSWNNFNMLFILLLGNTRNSTIS